MDVKMAMEARHPGVSWDGFFNLLSFSCMPGLVRGIELISRFSERGSQV
jgi:hypothetical protein